MTTQRKLESTLETKFYNAVRSVLGGKSFKFAPTTKGNPDRVVLLPGGIIELVELKREGELPSPKQRHWHAQAAMLGVKVAIVTGEAGLRAWVAQHLERMKKEPGLMNTVPLSARAPQ
jgi:hypothetical protein